MKYLAATIFLVASSALALPTSNVSTLFVGVQNILASFKLKIGCVLVLGKYDLWKA